ncbi:hypothetical protein D3C75_1033550 [compost metagenome]
MRDAPDMPQLQEDPPAGAMNGLGDVGPAAHLVIGPDTRGVRITDTHWRHRSGFAEDQAGAGTLHVVLGHQRVGYPAFIGAAAGQRSHDDAVRQFEVAEGDRIENSCHRYLKAYQ